MRDEALVNVHMDALRYPNPCGTALEQLILAVQTHVQEETGSIAAYERINHVCADPVVKAVTELILEDEKRHHAALERAATTLQAEFNWTAASSGTAAPNLDGVSMEELRRLADDERHGARALRELARQCREIGDDLTGALLESIAMDNDKHAHLLDIVIHWVAAHGAPR